MGLILVLLIGYIFRTLRMLGVVGKKKLNVFIIDVIESNYEVSVTKVSFMEMKSKP